MQWTNNVMSANFSPWSDFYCNTDRYCSRVKLFWCLKKGLIFKKIFSGTEITLTGKNINAVYPCMESSMSLLLGEKFYGVAGRAIFPSTKSSMSLLICSLCLLLTILPSSISLSLTDVSIKIHCQNLPFDQFIHLGIDHPTEMFNLVHSLQQAVCIKEVIKYNHSRWWKCNEKDGSPFKLLKVILHHSFLFLSIGLYSRPNPLRPLLSRLI